MKYVLIFNLCFFLARYFTRLTLLSAPDCSDTNLSSVFVSDEEWGVGGKGRGPGDQVGE